MSLLEVSGLGHAYGDKVLYQNAAFELYKGEHMGVVGQNGAGKSTLIGILTGEVVPDKGTVRWQGGIRLGYLDQYAKVDLGLTISGYLRTAFDGLYQLERQVQELYGRYAQTGDERLLAAASDGQTQLEARDFYTVDTRMEKVARGLGLDALGMERPLEELSGGQRAKVILAKLLLEQPDVLLLDEPTNFLDSGHVDWLVGFLCGFPNAFVVVSHDFAFLDRVSGCICDVEAGAVRKYNGTYSQFLTQKEHLREDYIRRYNAQQQMIRRTEDYIRRNIAGQNSKNAKGRRKQLENLERIAPPSFVIKPSIRFHQPQNVAPKALEVAELEVGYSSALLPKLGFTVAGGETMVITGFNGIGKSTLLKTLVGEIPSISGGFHFADQVKIGYYEQDLHWEDGCATPVQVIAAAYPQLSEKQIRKHLAGCGVRQDSVRQPVSTLSGGEQSKVKLCRMLLAPCNFLILDEPTNHLDGDTKEELRRALEQFSGSVLLVSHEEAFYKGLADRVFHIEKGVCA